MKLHHQHPLLNLEPEDSRNADIPGNVEGTKRAKPAQRPPSLQAMAESSRKVRTQIVFACSVIL